MSVENTHPYFLKMSVENLNTHPYFLKMSVENTHPYFLKMSVEIHILIS